MNIKSNVFPQMLTLLLMLVGSSPLLAQETESDQETVRAYRMQHVAAELALEIISDEASRATVDPVNNTLVVLADRKTHQRIASMLEEIDQMPEPESPAEIRVFELKYAAADDMVMSMSLFFQGRNSDIRFSSHPRSNAVICTASTKQLLAEVQDLIAKLDVEPVRRPMAKPEPESVSIRVLWLAEGAEVRELPKALAKVTQKLKETGALKNASVLTEASTAAIPGTPVAGPASFSNMSSRSGNNMKVQGTIMMVDEDRFRVGIETQLTVSEDDQPTSGVNINTELLVPRDHPVAFSVNDVGGMRTVVVLMLESM